MRLDAQVVGRKPDILVVGPSFARTDIDSRVLSAELDGLRVSVLAQNMAIAPMWYAMLKYRAYQNGAHPRVIMVVATAAQLLSTVPDATHMPELTQHFSEPDEILYKKAYQTDRHPRLQRALEQRAQLRDVLLEPARHAMVGWIWGADHTMQNGQAITDQAASVVFQDTVRTSSQQLMAVVEEEAATERHIGEQTVAPADSFLPDLAALARQNNAQLLVVLPPTTRSEQGEAGVSRTQEQEMVELATRLEIGWMDLRTLELPLNYFKDEHHLTTTGATAFSKIVAQRIKEMGGLDGKFRAPLEQPIPRRVGKAKPFVIPQKPSPHTGECMVRLALPEIVPFSVENLFATGTGAVSPLQVFWGDTPLKTVESWGQLGVGCSARSVNMTRMLTATLPSTQDADLRIDWNEALPLPLDDEETTWSTHMPDQWWVYPETALHWDWKHNWAPPQTPVTLSVSVLGVGEGIPLLSFGGEAIPLQKGIMNLYQGELTVPAPAEPWQAVLSAPAGMALLVRELGVKAGDQYEDIISKMPPRSIPLFRVVSFPEAPPPIDITEIEMVDGQASFQVDQDWLNCSPYMVLEDGVELPALPPQYSGQMGKTYLREDRVFFFSSDGSSPLENGRHYDLVYRADRRCEARAWLLPQDHIVVTVPSFRLRELLGPTRQINISALSNDGSSDGSVWIKLSHGDDIVVDMEVPVADLLEGLSWEPPERGMLLDLEAFVLEIKNIDASALLLDGRLLGQTDE